MSKMGRHALPTCWMCETTEGLSITHTEGLVDRPTDYSCEECYATTDTQDVEAAGPAFDDLQSLEDYRNEQR